MALTFDGAAKLIILDASSVLSVRDLWSDWVRWHATSDNSKYLTAFRLLGGDPIDTAQGTAVPFYAYLQNGWRIRPQEADHTLSVNEGVLLVEGGGSPFVPTLGAFTVQVNYQQPVQAIAVGSAGGALTTADIAAAIRADLAAELATITKVGLLHGVGADLTVTPTSRTAGAVTQTITTTGTGSTAVTVVSAA